MFSGKKGSIAVVTSLVVILIVLVIAAQVISNIKTVGSATVTTTITDQQITVANNTLIELGNTNIDTTTVVVTNSTNASNTLAGNFTAVTNGLTFNLDNLGNRYDGVVVNVTYDFADQTRDAAYNTSVDGEDTILNASSLTPVLAIVSILVLLFGIMAVFMFKKNV
jgi:hypothetical protein